MCDRAIICLVRTKPIWNAALCVTNFYIELRWEKQGHLRSCDPRRPLLLPLSFHHPDGETVAHISIISERFNVQFLLYPWCRQNTLTLTLSLSSFWNTLLLPFIANPVWLRTCPVSLCRQIQHRHGSSIFSHPSNGRLLPNVCCYLHIFTLINTPHIPHSAASNEAIYSLRRERLSPSVCLMHATDLHLSTSPPLIPISWKHYGEHDLFILSLRLYWFYSESF